MEDNTAAVQDQNNTAPDAGENNAGSEQAKSLLSSQAETTTEEGSAPPAEGGASEANTGAAPEGGEAAKPEGEEQPHWSEALPEDMREAFKGFEDKDKALENIKSLMEAKADVPDSPDGYKVPVPDALPQNEALEKEFKALAHETGLTKSQAEKLATWHNNQQLAVVKALDQMAEQTESQLRKEHGDAFPAVLETAQRGYQNLATPELRKLLESSGYNNHPAVVDTFYRLGKSLDEGSLVKGGPTVKDVQRDAEGRPRFKFKE